MVICMQWNLKDKGVITMDGHRLEEYDLRQLEEAKKIIVKVYEYHYGDSYMRKEIKRLETIIQKLDYLLTV